MCAVTAAMIKNYDYNVVSTDRKHGRVKQMKIYTWVNVIIVFYMQIMVHLLSVGHFGKVWRDFIRVSITIMEMLIISFQTYITAKLLGRFSWLVITSAL